MRINDAPYDVTLTFLQTGVAIDVRKAREIVWSQGGFSDSETAMRAYCRWRGDCVYASSIYTAEIVSHEKNP